MLIINVFVKDCLREEIDWRWFFWNVVFWEIVCCMCWVFVFICELVLWICGVVWVVFMVLGWLWMLMNGELLNFFFIGSGFFDMVFVSDCDWMFELILWEVFIVMMLVIDVCIVVWIFDM